MLTWRDHEPPSGTSPGSIASQRFSQYSTLFTLYLLDWIYYTAKRFTIHVSHSVSGGLMSVARNSDSPEPSARRPPQATMCLQIWAANTKWREHNHRPQQREPKERGGKRCRRMGRSRLSQLLGLFSCTIRSISSHMNSSRPFLKCLEVLTESRAVIQVPKGVTQANYDPYIHALFKYSSNNVPCSICIEYLITCHKAMIVIV